MTYSSLSRLMIGVPDRIVPDWLADLAARGLKSVCIYGENVESEEQLTGFVTELRKVLGPDAIIAIDEEGGEVTRVDYQTGSRFAGNGYLGKLDDPVITARDGARIAELLTRVGINLNLAPVADVNIEPKNPVIGIRSFGADQDLVARHVAAFVSGHEASGVGTTLKHFPGHGNTVSDSHLTLPKIVGGMDELLATQIKPFEAGITAGASAVMLAHLDLGLSAPSSLSQEVVELLRGQLGFEGLIVTDALDMGALGPRSELPNNAIRAMLVGVDLVCLGPRSTLEELLEIEKLASDLGLDLLESSQQSFERMKIFSSKTPSLATEVHPEYPSLLEGLEGLAAARIIRFQGTSNPAVGEVPWYSSIAADHEVNNTQELEQQLELSEMSIVLFRNALQMEAAVAALPESAQEKLYSVVPDPIMSQEVKTLVTYGSAQPQSEMLRVLLQERLTSNVK